MDLSSILSCDSNLSLQKGERSITVTTISTINEIEENSLVFVKSKKFLNQLVETKCNSFGVVLGEFEADLSNIDSKLSFIITSSNVDLSMSRVSKIFYDKINENINLCEKGDLQVGENCNISQDAFIGKNVEIGNSVTIMPNVTIMANVKIGNNSVIYPNVSIYPHSVIGKDCRIHSCTVIGSDGFGYNFVDGVHQKLWHIGGVIIGDNVELGANVCVDQGTFAPTKIGNGTKIDNQVQIAHNTILENGVIMCGQSGTAGSAKLGSYVVVGGKAGIGPDVAIGDQSQVAGNAMCNSKEYPPKSILAGHPARDLKDWLRGVAFVRKASLRK